MLRDIYRMGSQSANKRQLEDQDDSVPTQPLQKPKCYLELKPNEDFVRGIESESGNSRTEDWVLGPSSTANDAVEEHIPSFSTD